MKEKKSDKYKKRIRILHVAEAAGGVDRYLRLLFKYMDRTNFENILLCSNLYNEEDYINIVDRVEYVEMAHSISLCKDLKSVAMIRKCIVKYKPDVVYAHSSKAGALLRMADIGIDNKVFYNPHGWSFNMRIPFYQKIIYANIERIQAFFTDKIICISDAEKKSALNYRICKNEKLHVIYNGIDLQELKNLKKIKKEDINIPRDAFVVGMVGRISEQKAPDVFVKAARIIKQKMSNAYFIIVGDTIAGSDYWKTETINLIRKYNLQDSFLITGWIENPMSYMRLFDVGTLLSRWEGFGLVLPEYMSAQIPIVATRVDAIPDLIENGVNGLLVDVDNPEEVAKAVLLINKIRDKLVENGKKIVETKFNAERVAIETAILIEKVLN